MITTALTGYIATVYGESRYFRTWGEARSWVENVKGGRK